MSGVPEEGIQYAIELGRQAVALDVEGNREGAAYFYDEAASVLENLSALNISLPDKWIDKATEYKIRATSLRNTCLTSASHQYSASTADTQSMLGIAQQKVGKALEADENGRKDEAFKLYIEAVEQCRSAIKATDDQNLKSSLTKLAQQALERAENLKDASGKLKTFTSGQSPGKSLENATKTSPMHSPSSPMTISGSKSYTEEEKRVIGLTSLINGRQYLPFMAGDLQERLIFSIPFTDKHGKLRLSPKQTHSLGKWSRPEEFSSDPKIIENIDCFAIKQTVVSDCSFVASLAVAAQYEKRYNKKLITNIIYPQNRNGFPIYNSSGKYMIKLRINGVARKVIIDDYLPISRHGEPLCSYSVNRNELWVSLLEKAYMKVMGGYDFPGSNSNIDLYALTGWIPERVAMKSSEETFNREALFKKLYDRFHKGDVLVTVATGQMSDAEAERTGLVSSHAYALLDIREVKGVRLLMLKNPWSHVRWRGNYSELDVSNWTDEMKKLLNYNPEKAATHDNGVFWIDYDSLIQFYDVFYLSWNPALFAHTTSTHHSWNAGLGPVKDLYNIGDNPQFSLTVRSTGSSAVWVLLSRHITDIEDFRENREYITVLVYKNEGKRVYYPSDPAPFIDGVRINSPHYLCKILQSSAGTHRYTLVVSQYEKCNTINYSLRVFSTCPFELKKIVMPYKYKEEITNGSWKGASAGGCGNHPHTYANNPRYQFSLNAAATELLIELKGPKQYQLGFDINCIPTSENVPAGGFSRKSSGTYRSGFVIMELDGVPPGVYQIVPSTYLPGQEGPFFLKVQSSHPIKLQRVQ